MEEILKDIGNIKCEKCGGICLLESYLHYFVCQDCGTKYIFEEKE